ncbi:superantigen-like protein [Staphylococcus schweitzeri]|uniref:Superantigen-like protein n=1 Tax=Staphylococcus schweitzeri TaxID=1654388 RepID=A0A2K4AIU6_9STAP|nr:superantigen-like protein [Staphylococcus schweitzeri]MBE2127513.1 superantigen-like protein [Staphylococcus schweitzeri]PNZ50012.1 superantigen-like protein [Staphylococcus schweitzeri]CDR53064.1 exotoxin [Staphylococcus schweitzeri]VEE64977.1 superantigen-like protein [Staphylococcus schweitzeri]
MKMTTIAKASLALGLLTIGVITTTTQSANVEKERTANLEKTLNANERNTSTANAEKKQQSKREALQSLNITTEPVLKQERSQSPALATMPQTKVTTSPSTNTPQPPTKTDTSQSSTAGQAQTEINPKYKDLRAYYTKPSLEFENQFGFMLKPWTTVRFMNVIPNYFIYKIALVGKDDKKYKEGPYNNIDVFIVLEDNKYELKKYSVGGITKTNSKKVDHKAQLSITKEDSKGTISHDISEYKITKEELSLKELDFKLRKQLIERHNLYGNIGSGTIIIKMKNGGKYTFELHKKLQEHRMADVIDATNIDKIEVYIK